MLTFSPKDYILNTATKCCVYLMLNICFTAVLLYLLLKLIETFHKQMAKGTV